MSCISRQTSRMWDKKPNSWNKTKIFKIHGLVSQTIMSKSWPYFKMRYGQDFNVKKDPNIKYLKIMR